MANASLAFGLGGFLINILTAPIAIAVDAVSFIVSALLLGTIRKQLVTADEQTSQ